MLAKEMHQAILKKKRDTSLDEYKENILLTSEIIEQIMEEHSLILKKVHKNIYLSYNKKIIEFDALIEAETPTGLIRWVSIELKESDVSKVISQALVRRDFVDYSYVILNNSVKWIVEYLIYVWNKYIKEYKIGFFSNNVFILQSKYIKSRIKIKLED